MNIPEMLGTAAGVGFLAGIRLYATVFALGFAIRFGLIELSEDFHYALVLGSLPVLITSGVLAAAELISDKLPWFDSIWDSIHTFIRPIGATALALTATAGMDPGLRSALVLITGGVALTSHTAKAATRVAVNQSPEPVSNWVVSFAEDMFIPLGIWLTVHYPLLILGVVIVFLVVFFWLLRAVVRFFRKRLRPA
jgi:uncharacterized membrane protein